MQHYIEYLNQMKNLHVFLLLLATASSAITNSRFNYQILPTSTYINVNGTYFTQASPQACYADCQSCQIQTLVCQECYAPYYAKTPQATCLFSSNYTLESSSNEMRSGAGFSIAGQSWTNYKVTNCSSQNINPSFTANLVAIQPVNNSVTIQYNRTLSIHNFLVITFMLITSEWNNSSSLTFSFFNQAGTRIIEDIKQTYLPNVPKQSLCNPTAVDQRFAIAFSIQDNNSTSISISIAGSAGGFSIATWAVLSGLCDSTCSSCSYSTDPKACLGCNYFLKQISDGSCSQCPTGFKLSKSNNFTFCQKCPIQYQACSDSQTNCFYTQLNATAANNCSLVYPGSFYDQIYEINEQIFAGSLFTVGGLSSPSLYAACGNQPLSSYTYVGQAQSFQPITRIFASLRQHISLSLSFNVFVVDMTAVSQEVKFQIYINSNLYDVKYLTIVGMSNLCGGPGLQSFMTFPPTQFYPDSQSDNVNLTIVANAQWGIRNLRLAFKVCDESCLTCGPNGCIECRGILQLQNGKCSQCPPGYGKNLSVILENKENLLCVACPKNCLNCTIQNKKVTCLNCSAPFFLFEGACQKRTNIGDQISATSLTGLSSSTCSVSVPSSTPQLQPTTFNLSQSVITTSIKAEKPHYKFFVQFYLLRVGLWSADDRIEVYLNDLLMLTKKYIDFGNKICNKTINQTDSLSFQSIQYTDSNNTLTLSFELVTPNGTKRTFGVSNIKVYPVGCQVCLNYPFTYKIQYSYDQVLNVVAIFSRTYKNTNSTLFMQIFQLILNGKALDYEIISNNSVSYNLIAYPPKDTIMGNLTLLCLFPQLVTTDINDPINTQPFFARLLAGNYTSSKTVDNVRSDAVITRFTPVQEPDAVSGVRTFFQVVSRTVIYAGFAFFFFGLQTICTHFMHNLQKIWLHIFLASLTAPGLLRYALSGFKQVQNQNIAVDPTSWQKGLPLELYYTSPVSLYSYTTDVNFFRNIYNIGVAFGVFMVFLLIMHFVTKKCITRQMTMNNIFLRHLKVTYHRRPFFYFNSVVFYQYLSLMLACFLQFTSIYNKTDQGSFSGVTAAAAIIAFILGTIYPIFHFLWLRHKQNTIGRDKAIEYANRYHEIFFRFVHKNIWEGSEITYAERVYNIYRFGEIWWFTLVATALYYNPQAQLYLMIITFALHMFVLLFTSLSRNNFFKVLKSLELALFVGLEIIMLACQTDNATLTTRSYNTLGNVAIAIIFCIIFCSLIRSIYNGWLLYREYSYLRLGQQMKSRMKQGEVMRRDEYFNSENGQENIQIEIAGTDRQ